MKDATQISEYLILLLLPTVELTSIHATGNINLLRRGRRSQEPGEVEHDSFIPLVLSATGEWVMKPMCFQMTSCFIILQMERLVC